MGLRKVCPRCRRAFWFRSSLASHMRAHLPDPIFRPTYTPLPRGTGVTPARAVRVRDESERKVPRREEESSPSIMPAMVVLPVALDPTPDPTPAWAGGGGEFSGAGASGSWDPPASSSDSGSSSSDSSSSSFDSGSSSSGGFDP